MNRKPLSFTDFRRRAKRRLPRAVFDFVDGAAETEFTRRANERVFEQVAIRPRQAVRVETPKLSTTVLGREISLPVLLAPLGMARAIAPEGDLAAVRAAGAAGTGFVLTTMSGHSIEEVAAASSGPIFYQVYQVGPRSRVETAVKRAKAANYDGLFVTVDTMRNGNRLRDERNGVYTLLGPNHLAAARYALPLLRHPFWLARRVADGMVPPLANVLLDDGTPQRLGRDRAASLSWDDIAWLRHLWTGPIVVKGVLTGDDARRALDVGADGVVVSNHGGRQLDFAEATLRVLPEIVAATNGRCEIILDSGIRRGTDVAKALALGARAVMIGRAWAWGLASGGQAGVGQVLELFRRELAGTLALIGCESVQDLDSSFVRAPSEWMSKP